MKTTKLTATLLALLATFSLASCSSDDDDNVANIEQPAKYADKAARYVISGNGQYNSIELTESGNYLIEKGSNYTSRAAVAEMPAKKRTSLLSKTRRAKAQSTRSSNWDNYWYGTYTLNSDGSFNLKDFGKLEVKVDVSGQCSLVLTPKDKEPVTLSAQKQQKSVEGMTAKLCRTWQFDSWRLVLVDKNGKTLIDHTASNDASMTKWLYNWEKKNDPDFDEEEWYWEDEDGKKIYYWEDPDELEETFIFTQSGTYLIVNDDELEVCLWRWLDEKTGQIQFGERYNGKEYWWNEDMITVSFSGNKMGIMETYQNDDYNDDCIYNGTTETNYIYFKAVN